MNVSHRQVFGLAGASIFPTGRSFPVHSLDQCLRTAFVPAHRCGTVPDFLRIPSSIARGRLAHALEHTQSTFNILHAFRGHANSPPWSRRGGRDIKKMPRSLLDGADGAV